MELGRLKKTRALLVTVSLLSVLIVGLGISYINGYRLTAFPPDNNYSCQGNADRPAGYKPPNLSADELKDRDTQFDIACPGFRSGWLWGDYWITKPLPDGRNFDRIHLGAFWQPYWGFILPDYNLGKGYLTFLEKH